MSPDIEWHIGDEEGQETLVKLPHKPSRRRWPLVVAMIILGASLGVLYYSTPSPPPLPSPPTPTPAPTPIPTSTPSPIERLLLTIDREAYALADGDHVILETLRDPQARGDLDQLESATWMHPTSGAWYRILAYGLLDDGTAWADVIQYRYGSYLRNTRFYTQTTDGGAWLRTLPDPGYWTGDQLIANTAYFRVAYYARDGAYLPFVVRHYAQIYEQLCAAYECQSQPAESISTTAGITLEIRADGSWYMPWQPSEAAPPPFTIYIPSPSVMGIAYRGLDARQPMPDLPIDPAPYYQMSHMLAEDLSGWDQRAPRDTNGWLLVESMVDWVAMQQPIISGFRTRVPAPQLYFEPFTNMSMPPLESLWAITPTAYLDTQWSDADALIYYLHEQYGADKLIGFLKAIGPARSLSEAIEHGLGVPYADFKRGWANWLKQQGVSE